MLFRQNKRFNIRAVQIHHIQIYPPPLVAKAVYQIHIGAPSYHLALNHIETLVKAFRMIAKEMVRKHYSG